MNRTTNAPKGAFVFKSICLINFATNAISGNDKISDGTPAHVSAHWCTGV